MTKTASSRRWLQEHFSDAYVQRAQAQGYRSRAVFKLQEIQSRDRILAPGMTVVDLGAAPGGWSQFTTTQVKPGGKVIAVDVLPMEPVPGVIFLQGDLTEEQTWQSLISALGDTPADVVLSDMAPNLSGNRSVDQPRAMYLAELALEAAEQLLREGGCLLMKLFQGEGFEAFQRRLRQRFTKVAIRKPKASRTRSREVYLLAQGFNPSGQFLKRGQV
ncbi:MAG: 23S rRNA (uridine(2552)-2'-O)-methyltransferase RlmE [Methylohalobius sp.]|nr:23S rRNA (uridine(2552)-2'-O)-methyltransferase RlmE [Methylohalobius sp.]